MTQFGGPQLGSGRRPHPLREEVRSVRLRLSMRPGEIVDLRAIAAAWGVPTGTAAWAILHDQLRRYRKLKAHPAGPEGAAAAALDLIRGTRAADSAECHTPPPPEGTL